MSRKKKALIGVIVALVLTLGLLFGGYKYGLKHCKPCPESVSAVQKEAVKKPQKAVKKQVTKQAAPVSAPVRQVAVPNVGATPFVLRIVVVEWSSVFEGKSLRSRDIGPIIGQGLANGTVVRTKNRCGFIVNGASVVVDDGHAIVDPGPIGPETTLTIQPSAGHKFASPPGGVPLTTNPGELDALVKRGSSEIWLCFILAPTT